MSKTFTPGPGVLGPGQGILERGQGILGGGQGILGKSQGIFRLGLVRARAALSCGLFGRAGPAKEFRQRCRREGPGRGPSEQHPICLKRLPLALGPGQGILARGQGILGGGQGILGQNQGIVRLGLVRARAVLSCGLFGASRASQGI